MNIFEQATRLALRFSTNKGSITTEDLWTLPLTSKAGFDLDNVAKAANADLKAQAAESFVSVNHSPSRAAANLRMDVVKHIIAVKLAEVEAGIERGKKLAQRDRVNEILSKREDAALDGLSTEELLKLRDGT